MSSDAESNTSTERDTVDGLAALKNGYVVTKCVGDDIISVWNVKDQLSTSNKSRQDKRKVKAHIRSVGVQPAALLNYTTQDVDYINMGTNSDMMVVGDDCGNLRLYNIKELINRKSQTCDDIMRPSRLLEWPEIAEGPMKQFCQREVVIVNSACASHDGEYVACGTDNNLVCVWRRSVDTGEENMMLD